LSVRDRAGELGAVQVADGAVVSELVFIVTDEASALLAGPALLAPSLIELALNRAATVPSLVHVAVTVNEVPDEADGENVQPVAVPVYVKSPLVSPEIDSEKAKVYERVRDDDGDDGGVQVAVGAVESGEPPVPVSTRKTTSLVGFEM
jgi:hypothetical protein